MDRVAKATRSNDTKGKGEVQKRAEEQRLRAATIRKEKARFRSVQKSKGYAR